MNRLKSALVTGALASVMAVGALAVTTTSASADVACNHWGECWRVHDRTVAYPGEVGIVFHDDGWWDKHHRHHVHWRGDHDGRGYWRQGAWVAF